MKGFEIVAQAVADEGVDTLFGVAGDGNLYLIDNLVREHAVRYIPAAHEAAAVMMAIGFARVRDTVGTATTTHGPGLANAYTALVEGARSRTPIVLVVGDTDPDRLDHLQDIDQRALAVATGAGFEQIRSLRRAPEDVSRARWRAETEQRPIVLNWPIEYNWVEGQYQQATRSEVSRQQIAPDPGTLDQALGLIASAKRPIVLAGRGAIAAREPLLALAERLGAPVATTVQATNLFRGAPRNLGIFGTLSHSVTAEAIFEADCIVAFGASLNRFTTDGGNLLRGKRVVHCDLEPCRFGTPPISGVRLLGDVTSTSHAMLTLLEAAGHCASDFGDSLLERLRARPWLSNYTDQGTADTLDPRVLTEALDGSLPQARSLTVDAGRFMNYALTVAVLEPTALVTTHGFGSIGLGTAAAIGAGAARPDRPAVALVGDGGFMMGGLAEFQTAVRCGVDLIVVIYNDGSYGAEHIQLSRKGLDPSVALNHWPDFATVAVAMGGEAITLRNQHDLTHLSERISSRQRPLLIDAKLDPGVMSTLQE